MSGRRTRRDVRRNGDDEALSSGHTSSHTDIRALLRILRSGIVQTFSSRTTTAVAREDDRIEVDDDDSEHEHYFDDEDEDDDDLMGSCPAMNLSTVPNQRKTEDTSAINREHALLKTDGFSRADCSNISCYYLPNKKKTVAKMSEKVFCGIYSQSGNIYLSACQDCCIRLYKTGRGEFKLFRSIHARDVGWSILDTTFSPDGNYLVYSSWSKYLHLCNIEGENQIHTALHLTPETEHSFCIFSIAFSQDNKEIMGGANDRCLYVFDRERNERTLRIEAHEDDVNAVSFADETSQILFSGSDDGLCKVWDRRTLREEDPTPVGVLAGHHDGITFIDSKSDGRYLISNCKDQTIKLWDIRHLSSRSVQEATRREVAKQNWDYRWQQVPHKVRMQRRKIQGDSSLMTYHGHCVLNTLVRCRFSPVFSTGQRYIYTGCATGAVVVYDLLTGEIVTKLQGHKQCIRDVSWHPFENNIISASWDCSVGRWTHVYQRNEEDMEEDEKNGEQKKVTTPSTGNNPMLYVE